MDKDRNSAVLRLLREPLVHFFAIGVLLFLLYGAMNADDELGRDEILIEENHVTALSERFEQTWQRPPTAQELRTMLDGWIREEVLYRQGLGMSLDQNDPIIRRRVVQKMEFISEGLVAGSPDDGELQAWLDDHPEDYRSPTRYAFRQIYFDPARHAEQTTIKIEQARESLLRGESEGLGDNTMLPESMRDVSGADIARIWGLDFAPILETLPLGEWSGPVRSPFGLHLVFVESRVPGQLPTLEEVRPALERDLLAAKAEEANDALLSALRELYTIQYSEAALELIPDQETESE